MSLFDYSSKLFRTAFFTAMHLALLIGVYDRIFALYPEFKVPTNDGESLRLPHVDPINNDEFRLLKF